MTGQTQSNRNAQDSLAAALSSYRDGVIRQAPADVLQVMASAQEALVASGIEESALKVGDTAPDFTLNDSNGRPTTLYSLLKKGPVVLSFFRGGWCPYCTLEARALNAALPEITAQGARLIAISPETEEATRETIQHFDAHFTVLPDTEGTVCARFGLTFTLPDSLLEVYKGFDIDIAAHNGNDRGELPIPATYVIGVDGKVAASHVSADYTTRMEPSEIVAALKAL